MKVLFDMKQPANKCHESVQFVAKCLTDANTQVIWDNRYQGTPDFAISDRRVDFWREKGVWTFDLEGNPADSEPFSDRTLIAWDVDGTLSNLTLCEFKDSEGNNLPGRRGFMVGHKSWPAFNAAMPFDTLNEETANLFKVMRDRDDVDNIIVTARDAEFRKVTLDWFAKYDITGYKKMYMRRQGSNVGDGIEKKLILDKIVEDWGKKPDLVIDDRPAVVNMWRENGIQVWDVNQTKEDF